MEAPKTLRRPANWQDFETLCKKLWGEIWDCPEIKKNGRNGQTQHGVDVYGIPFGEEKYYGIQCKGKDEYTNSQFTEDEITEEIEKAKNFQPPLKKLYFATTAVKGAKIEQFVREKNVENIKQELFEVHIFSWEDIVDLIDENKQTHAWYVKSQNFKTSKSVSVTWQGGVTELTIKPKFKTVITHYMLRSKNENPNISKMYEMAEMMQKQQSLFRGLYSNPMAMTEVNLSYCKLRLQIHNTGTDQIENFKLSFQFEGEITDLADTNVKDYGLTSFIASAHRRIPNIGLSNEQKSGKVVPQTKILVGDDNFHSDDFFIKPLPKEYDLLVKWKLISSDLKAEGTLNLLVRPEIARNRDVVYVEDKQEVRTEGGEKFEDVIVPKKEAE